jgi:hypothetical protein
MTGPSSVIVTQATWSNSMPAGAVGDDGELEVLRIVVEIELRPGVGAGGRL